MEWDPRLSRRPDGAVGACGAMCSEADAVGGLSLGDSLHKGSEHRDTPKSLTPPLWLFTFSLVFIFNRIGVFLPLSLCFCFLVCVFFFKPSFPLYFLSSHLSINCLKFKESQVAEGRLRKQGPCWPRSDREAAGAASPGRSRGERRLPSRARPRPPHQGPGPTASPWWPGTGRLGELRALGEPCAASPGQRVSL